MASCFLLGIMLPVGTSMGADVLLSCLTGELFGGAAAAMFWVRWLQDKLLYHPRRYSSNGAFDHESEPQKVGGRLFTIRRVAYSFPGAVSGRLDQTALLLRPCSEDADTMWVIFGG